MEKFKSREEMVEAVHTILKRDCDYSAEKVEAHLKSAGFPSVLNYIAMYR